MDIIKLNKLKKIHVGCVLTIVKNVKILQILVVNVNKDMNLKFKNNQKKQIFALEINQKSKKFIS